MQLTNHNSAFHKNWLIMSPKIETFLLQLRKLAV